MAQWVAYCTEPARESRRLIALATTPPKELLREYLAEVALAWQNIWDHIHDFIDNRYIPSDAPTRILGLLVSLASDTSVLYGDVRFVVILLPVTCR